MNQHTSTARLFDNWIFCVTLAILISFSGTGCRRSSDESGSQKNNALSSGPASFANAKLTTADSVALVEISSLGQLHQQLIRLYDQVAAQNQTNSQTLKQYLEVSTNALGFNPSKQAEIEKASGIDFSKPVSCGLRITAPVGSGGTPSVQLTVQVPISDSSKANELIGRLTRLSGASIQKKSTAEPTIYSLTTKSGYSDELQELAAYSINDQILTVFISDFPSLNARSLAEHLLQAKAQPLEKVEHFQQTLPYLAADNQIRLFLNIKSIAQTPPLNRTPVSPLAGNFEAFGLTAGTQRLQAALTLNDSASIKKYMQPGDTCQQLLAKADKPLAAFSASLNNPLGLFDYLLQYTDPRSWNREKGRMQQEIGVSYQQLSNLTTKGSGALLVYPAPDAGDMVISFMGVVKTTDRNLTQHLLQQLAKEGGFNAIKYGNNTVWRANTSQRRGPVFAFALLDNHVLAGTAVSQIHNLVNQQGSGWKPSVGGKELIAGEIDLVGVLTFLATYQDIPDALRPNIFKIIQSIAKEGSQLKLKATMKDRALVASIDLTGMTWPDGLTTIGKLALQNSLTPISQSGLNLPTFHPVQGQITLDGKPLAGARVAFHRTDAEASRIFAATSNARGYYEILAPYSIEVYQGAPVGKYKVTVIKTADPELGEKEFDEKYQAVLDQLGESAEPVTLDAPAYLVDEQYTSQQTTPFEVNVQEGRNSFNFNLTSKPSPDN